MKALLFDLILEQPVFIARPAAGEENSSESMEFIPGASLRGALIGLYLASHPGKDISHDDKCREWFFTGEHCFLNGYSISPASQDRLLPKPLSLRMEKDQRGTNNFRVVDFAVEENPSLKMPVLPSFEFVEYAENERLEVMSVKRTLSPHNASITRQVKRADESFVFLYDVLAAGQTFSAAILGEDVLNLKDELGLANGQLLFLGGSRSANYGRVRLSNVRVVEDWKEYRRAGSAPDGTVLVTLLSDAILVGKNGQPATNPDEFLGCSNLRSFQKTRLTGGFNRKWGLPLPQVAALQAGSVFVYDASKIRPDLLQKLVENGIGERRVEGYGRVAVDWNCESRAVAEFHSYPGQSGQVKQLSASSKKLLNEMVNRRLRSILDGRILASIELIAISNPPGNSQLSQIRQAAKEAAASQTLLPLSDRLEQMKRVARRQFEKARVKEGEAREVSLDEWLTHGLSADFSTNLWRLLDTPTPRIAGQGIDKTSKEFQAIQTEYIARFVEGLMRKVIRARQAEPVEEVEE